MPEELMSDALPSLSALSTNKGMTRRQVLRTLAQSGAAVGAASIGGALLTACGGGSGNSTEAVTLLLGDWPMKATLITSKTKPANADDTAEKEILQAWLDKNKNVTFKSTAIDVSDDVKAQQALSTRNAPHIMGTFQNMSFNRAAPKLGVVAEVTDLYRQYNMDSQLADYAKPLWEQSYNLGGHYYAFPGDGVGAGAGLYYRRDLLKAKGIEDPKFGWTWDDLISLIKQFQTDGKPVMGAPSYMFGWMLNSNLLDPHPNGVLGSVPAPKNGWHWQVKTDPWIDEWKRLATTYRGLTEEQNLIEQNSTAYPWEGPAMGKFAAGQYPFSPGFAFQGTITGYAPITPAEMPAKFGKSFDELVGFVAYPKGFNGGYNPGIYAGMTGQVMFPRYLHSAALAAAVDLYYYRIYGDGYKNKYAKIYDLTKDPKQAYKFIAPANRFQKNPALPADVTVENAFGPKWVNSYMEPILKLAPMPVMALYFPPDKQTGPAGNAHSDMLETLSIGKDDIAAAVKKFQDTYNEQASSLNSDVTTDEFIPAAKNYLSALDAFFKKNLPDFYAGDWTKYYHNYALPALS